ncbi:hypothetical protein SAMN05216296_1997 [Pseudomonas pohangensis]|uniref:Wadjet protein JetD C-terminal domain-containing protein n=1 Tax=Pseudomonas pohangensis TaxID=364197 RepID=A0A1H2G3Q0_9PSED|nr:hypothetical protein [Pseudomonas pohangensis]SDU13918.1 hypothetical protein SAMN05216296_1997 [Pseudomonas pohangensis]
MSGALADALGKLLASENGLAHSQFTLAQRGALDDFARKTGAVRLQSQGRGSLFRVIDRPLAEAHLRQLRPLQGDAVHDDLPIRAANVGMFRSSKGSAAGHACQYLILKSIDQSVRWHDGQGQEVDLPAITQLCGAATLAIRPADDWSSASPLWLVENQALFDDLRWLPTGACGTLCYYAGQLSGVVLDWLQAKPRASQIILFPDCDGIGLQNFARLRERVGDACEFWMIPGWRDLIQRYGNRKIWQDNLANFQDAVARLTALGMQPELADLCHALQSSAMALEQEVVFLSAGP